MVLRSGAISHRMLPFIRSVLLGSLAAAAPLLVFTVILAVGSPPEVLDGGGRLFPSFWLAIVPLVVSFPLVLAASVLVRLPLTAFLKHREWESGAAYISVGAELGFIIPLAILLLMNAPAEHWMALTGAVGGAVTGRTWWVSDREQQVSCID